MKIFLLLSVNLWLILTFKAQTIQCTFPSLAGQLVKFGTFDGLQSVNRDSVRVSSGGKFLFRFSSEKPGVGYLITAENKPYFLILDKEHIEISGEYLSDPTAIRVVSGKQNQAFAQYGSEHPRREQALSAWRYLDRIYSLDPLFMEDKKSKDYIAQQYQAIKKEDLAFLKALPKDSYIAWYLPVRRLVSDVSIIAQYRTEEIPATISAFRKLDYTDERLYRSGLLKDAIESHFWLLENSGRSIDSVYIEMQTSIDSMFMYLVKDEQKLNQLTDYLFDLLERHSLFRASEYLALKVLNEVSCTINSDLAKQLETYRAMKKGNIAPEIMLKGNAFSASMDQNQLPRKLSDIQTPYTLVVFGAGWCEKCKEELPKIANLYTKWKQKGLEVLFISLDENEQDFKKFASAFPFIYYCDYQKWNSPIATDCYVFGTPTLFLLDKKREIILRPNSINQMDAWVDWYLK